MKNFQITNKNGIKLKTSNKYVDEDINISIDSTNLVSENIKNGVEILGVTGTMQSSSGGADITANIKVTNSISDIMGTEHNKLCILNDTNGLSFKVVDKIDSRNEEILTLNEVLPDATAYAFCARFNDNIYIFGGANNSSTNLYNRTNIIYKFNCKTKNIETLSVRLPQILSEACCSTYNDNIYIFGGASTSVGKTIYKFNCTTETIETLSVTLPQPVSVSFCCSTYENNIYLFGGHNDSNRIDTIYNLFVSFELPANNVLIYNANSNYSFDLITDQVTIPINKVYIGNNNNKSQFANAYLYDETQMAWVNINTGEILTK